jgi:hypothetical protein
VKFTTTSAMTAGRRAEPSAAGTDGTRGPLLRLTDTPANYVDVTAAVGPDGSGIVISHDLPGGTCGATTGRPCTLREGPTPGIADRGDRAAVVDSPPALARPKAKATIL